MNYCTSCFPECVDYGEIYPGHNLLYDNSGTWNYKIVNEHDEVLRFGEKPYGDPFNGMSDEEVNTASESQLAAFTEYCHQVETFRMKHFKFHPQHGHHMMELCKQVGYNPDTDGWLDHWIINRAAKMIADKEKEKPV